MSSRHESTSVPTTSASDEQVLASVYNFDDFTIRKFVHGKTTILEASGSYSVALAKEIERLTNHVRGALGLDLHAVTGLQPAILSVLTRIRRRFAGKRRQFLLSDPPERLLDLLKLNELLEHFQIVQSGKPALSAHAERPTTSTGKHMPVKTPQSSTAAPARRKIEHLTKSLRRTEILEKGLDSASKCVRRFLPSKPPEVQGFDFAFSMGACDKVGGDFFDFIEIDAEHLGVSIGDVSGHGIDSAIIMGMAKKVVRLRAKQVGLGSPAEVLSMANEDLYEELGRRTFVTALYARIHIPSGKIDFARAGHEPPLKFMPGWDVKPHVYQSDGFALGIDSGGHFRRVINDAVIELAMGESLLLYTDGIVERWNKRHDLFSRDRLLYLLETLPEQSGAGGILDRINLAVDQFAEGTQPEDDMTAIVIVRTRS